MQHRAAGLIALSLAGVLLSAGCINIYTGRDWLPPQPKSTPRYADIVKAVLAHNFTTRFLGPDALNSTQSKETENVRLLDGTLWLQINISVTINVIPDIITKNLPITEPYVKIEILTTIGEVFYAEQFDGNAERHLSVNGPMSGDWIVHVEAVGYGEDSAGHDSYSIALTAREPVGKGG